jgi:ABC-type multidrug transport system permease subunit
MSTIDQSPVRAEKPSDKFQKHPGSGPALRNGRWSGFTHILVARMKELKREPEVIFWVVLFPVLLALGLGIAFRNKPADTTSIAIVEGIGAQESLSMIQQSPKHAMIHAQVVSSDAALAGLRLGKFDLVVVPRSSGCLEQRYDNPRVPCFEYHYDPARPESVLSHAEVDDALQTAAGRKDPLQTSVVATSEPGSRYIDFLIPGLIGMNLMNSGMWGVGFALVEMRQRKLLKRFVATPMRRSDFLLALMTSRLILMFIEVGLLLVFGVLFFHMRVLGSVATILLLGAIGSVAFGGLGLLTASRAQKIESISGLMNAVMMPMWIFSGVFFSYERFPAIIQPFIKALPLTALNDALRASILEGATLASQSGRLLVLLLWGGVSFVLAVRWFRWT